MSQKNETTILILALVITIGLLVTGFWVFNRVINPQKTQPLPPFTGRLEKRISLGNKILVNQDRNPNKEAGVTAFAKGDFSTAISQLESSLRKKRNDPEAWIYFNNAKATQNNPLKIGVSVPIGGNLNIAKEILRGVAQAQDETNNSGGINGMPLQVEIANDDNDPSIVKKIADKWVKDTKILAVVGHNTSDASLAGAPIYQQGNLVMISPTSNAKKLSGIGSYIFRTIPSISSEAEVLARYALKTNRLSKLAICADSQAKASQSFKEEFIAKFDNEGGEISQIACDFSEPNFNASAVISQAVSDGAEGLVLAASVDKIKRSLDISISNKGRLSLMGNSTLYTIDTLKFGQADANEMVLAAPWHPQAIPDNPFPKNARNYWGGDVNWRSALAYDATQAIIAGLNQDNTRQGLRKALSSSQFSANGATGKIQFLPSGDRNASSILVKIQPGQSSGTGYDFAPLPQ
ncbi:MAG TPA: ABC transporter substrate-binding protein [Cyanobacteria bacterium UBA11369]|nr:ABC transporter substrate-binding protein [Cyanobacteria bacterium UBA11371]HBE32711.1 ABC transporter substrate-binding protein [Cyanobacteria bacterium UBA11368]HBE49613.1 ABC transporter substrate-binding protein [Cyanobacteria bacterium UBA11369]